MNKIIWWLGVAAACFTPAVVLAADSFEPEDIYRDLQDRIFQVQVIDKASDKKMSIGTGFRVSADGLIATNYHVVAAYMRDPEQYRVEYLAYDGSSGIVTVRDIDVIHDLALVQATDLPGEEFLQLKAASLAKGTRMFAIGNPRDLGMVIVPGTFNGQLEKSLYEKILFSGTLNPGMSGGPAINRRGEVIGVNVSTAGNELSFLIPVRYLQALLEGVQQAGSQEINLTERITQQLHASQQQTMEKLLSGKWKTMQLGKAQVPAELASYFKCWGQTDNKTEQRYSHTYSACASPDSVYISDRFETGSIDFRYDMLSSDKLNSLQFYNLYANRFADGNSTNMADEDDVRNYRCNSRFIEITGKTWKAAMCIRAYKKFKGLYDVSLNMASLGETTSGLIVTLNASGLTKENAQALIQKFMENLTWRS